MPAMRSAAFAVLALGLAVTACSAPSEDCCLLKSLSRDVAAPPALDATGATCTGQFWFDSATHGTGRSECANGEGVPFRAVTADAVKSGLICNYTLVYDMKIQPQQGTGEIACNDGVRGKLTFRRTRPNEGEAVAMMADRRIVRFTYFQ
ncbi:hypothetical protein [Dongia sp. agr-C8]